MEVEYRGCDISVVREKSMAGYTLLFYSIFRKADGYEITSGFEDSNEKVRDMVKIMKSRVDGEIEEAGSLELVGAEIEI